MASKLTNRIELNTDGDFTLTIPEDIVEDLMLEDGVVEWDIVSEDPVQVVLTIT